MTKEEKLRAQYEAQCSIDRLLSLLDSKDEKIAELKARIEKQNTDILTLKGLTERQRAQIEKMKMCSNCQYVTSNIENQLHCKKCKCNHSEWQLREVK